MSIDRIPDPPAHTHGLAARQSSSSPEVERVACSVHGPGDDWMRQHPLVSNPYSERRFVDRQYRGKKAHLLVQGAGGRRSGSQVLRIARSPWRSFASRPGEEGPRIGAVVPAENLRALLPWSGRPGMMRRRSKGSLSSGARLRPASTTSSRDCRRRTATRTHLLPGTLATSTGSWPCAATAS